MKCLELFSGTGSVGKELKKNGYDVISLDLKNADINIDILKWDYKIYEPNYFHTIWASPPCDTFSSIKNGHIITKTDIENDIKNFGLPILYKTLEIILYFNPIKWVIENPQTGAMKKYLNLSFFDIDYCQYADWGYRKRTRLWTNIKGFKPKKCKQDCNSCIDGKHIINFGVTKKNRFKDRKSEYTNLKERYRIPPLLIKELLL